MSDKRAGSITSYDRRSHEARISPDFLADLFRNVPLGMCVYELEDPDDDRSLRLVAANPAAAASAGVRAEDIVGRTIDECFPELRAKDIPRRFAEVVRSGRPTSLDAFQYQDDRLATGVFSAMVFPLDMSRVCVMLEDNTDQRRIESMLRLTQFAVDRIADTVFWMTPDARLIYVNDAACESLGYSREELLAMRLYDIDPLISEEVWQKGREEIGGHRARTRESIYRRKDGREFPVEISVHCLKWDGGEYHLCFVRDISGKEKAEKEIRATNEQLRQERQALEEKDVAMREVLARVEEEKQTTREQIRINVEEALTPLLVKLRERSDEAQRRLLDLLEQHLRDITSPFLDILRTSFSKLTPREQEVCLMIKAGRRSKEIAGMLNISLLTIHKHREKIRKKLGLNHTSANLNSFLKSL